MGDSIGYWVGDKWGDKILRLPLLRKRQKGIESALEQLRKRGALFVFIGRFTAFFRAVIPGLAGLSKMRYRVFLPANAAGGLCWGVLFLLLGYFVGQAIERAAGIASDVLLGIIVLVVVVLVHPAPPQGEARSWATPKTAAAGHQRARAVRRRLTPHSARGVQAPSGRPAAARPGPG